MESQVDKKGIVKALTLSLLIALAAIAVLGWQYRKIETERIPALEERAEQNSAEAILNHFMRSRIDNNEAAAMQFLTERAVAGKDGGDFSLTGGLTSYEIISGGKVDEQAYRYLVRLNEKSGFNSFIEVIILTKILDNYYVDSVQIAG